VLNRELTLTSLAFLESRLPPFGRLPKEAIEIYPDCRFTRTFLSAGLVEVFVEFEGLSVV